MNIIHITRVFFERMSIAFAVAAVLLIVANLVEAAGFGPVVPYRETVLKLIQPVANILFPKSLRAGMAMTPLEIYPQATLVFFITCFASSWVSSVMSKLELRLAYLNLTFPMLLKKMLAFTEPAVQQMQDNQLIEKSMGLVFIKVDSHSDNAPIVDLMEAALGRHQRVSVISCQGDAYCVQAPCLMDGVRFVQDAVQEFKDHNRSLLDAADAISFKGVLHVAASTLDLMDEDSFMRAVLECCGKNQFLVTAEARKVYYLEVRKAQKLGQSSAELEMIYHGNYMSMGPRMNECEVYRLVKQL